MKKVCVIGLGYIGLPTACILASNGIDVIGVDINENVVNSINNNKIHIEEPDLQSLLNNPTVSSHLHASTSPIEADSYIISVPTPVNKDKTADLGYVIQAAKSILKLLKKGDLVVLESTSPPETTKAVVAPILESTGLNVGSDIYLAYCPEKVLPGKILREIVENKRIIGGINDISAEKARELYSIFVKGEIITTNSTTAEMIKIAENTFRDINIAYANELAKICAQLNINVWDVIKYANMHPRVNIHQPGIGVGGHCIPVDPWFIIEKCPDITTLPHCARTINDSMVEYTYNLIMENIKDISNPNVTLLGLAYKQNSDDLRESPAIELANLLKNNDKINLKVYDPYAKNYQGNESCLEDALIDCDCMVLTVNHNEFASINPKLVVDKFRNKIVIDTKNIFNKDQWIQNGFKYILLGSN